VAAMVERLPVVIPDIPEWEEEYMMLRAYLDTYGKQFPEETGFMPKDKEEDHVVQTHEEMIGQLMPISFDFVDHVMCTCDFCKCSRHFVLIYLT
jgi:hypothetical protein